MQPLDVAVFRGMKESWRNIVADWKAECFKKGINHNSIHKQVKSHVNLFTVI